MPIERREANAELIVLRQEVDSLKEAVEQLSDHVKELLEAWNAANGILKLIKWLAVIGGGLATIVAAVKGFRP